MYKTFRHGGKIGDVIFSLPVIRELGGGILYLPESTPDDCNTLYSSLKDLLEAQPFIQEVREYPSGLPYMQLAPGIHIDYDLDLARLQPMKGVIHIVKRYLDAFDIRLQDWQNPSLQVDDIPTGIPGKYTVIQYTGRHIVNEQMQIKSRVNWTRVLNEIDGLVVFVGTEDEFESFSDRYGPVVHIATDNILQVARIIRDAEAVYCNQSMCLALAQGLGKKVFIDVKPNKTNCLLYTKNENILL